MRCGVASNVPRSRSSGGGSSRPAPPRKRERISGCATAGALGSREPPPPMPHPTSSSLGRSCPPQAPLPALTTFFDRAANAPLDDLIGIGRSLLARLERDGCRVNVAIERETTTTRVANTAGAGGEYRGTGCGVSADVWRIAGDDVLVVSDALEGADLPSDEALAALVVSINARLDHALRVVAPPEGALPVVFTPAGLSALMLPVTQGLSGKAVLQGISPLGAKLGEQVFDAR